MARFKERQVEGYSRKRYKPNGHLENPARNALLRELILACGMSAREGGEFLALVPNGIYRLVEKNSRAVLRQIYLDIFTELFQRVLTNTCLRTDPPSARKRADLIHRFMPKPAPEDEDHEQADDRGVPGRRPPADIEALREDVAR